MRVVWTKPASQTLRKIFKYYEREAGRRIAGRIISRILRATAQIEKFPESGRVEENLKSLNENHRYILRSGHKIIYNQVEYDFHYRCV